ncbi:MAG: SH3 domain-containing protein [Roseburia sp.]|nr:SH3 domain-containing protein [Roseburia sp.]
MNKYGMRIVACALAGTLVFSGYQMTLEARVSHSSVPVAGIAVALDEGSTIQDLQIEVVENIAYLESVSGVRPNIVEAAERAAISELGIWSVVQSVPEALVRTPEVLGSFLEATEASVASPQADDAASEAAETPQSGEEADAQDETDDVKLSAGFSATEVYDGTDTDTDTEEEGTEATEEMTEEETTEEETEEAIEEEATEEETEEEQDFSGLVIARVNNYVNVRSIPSEEGEIVGKLYDKSVGEFIEEENGWYKITSGNCTGYVKGEFCVVGEEAEALAKEVGTTYAIVNTTTLKVRKEAGTDSAVLGLVPIGEELIVVEELDGWVKIAIEEGDGYVSREFVNLRTDFVHAESKEEEEARLAREAQAREAARAAAASTAAARAAVTPQEKSANTQAVIASAQSTAASSEGSEMGKAVINYATQFVGNPYVYGGSSLTNGTDCSGFVMSVYANFGVSLPHSSSALRSQGYDVGGLENAQPGDIVCYSGHVGLYVGNGQIVHASNSKTGIIVSSATYRSVLTVRRIF